jgi:hypothetical protein
MSGMGMISYMDEQLQSSCIDFRSLANHRLVTPAYLFLMGQASCDHVAYLVGNEFNNYWID